jgi:signal transduction histidine kinase
MDQSFGEGYISKVQSQQLERNGTLTVNSSSGKTALIAGDIALDRLKDILLVLNGLLLLVVPGLAWLLTSRTLRPIEKTYAKQRQFVSDASHELRTPLTIMQGELDITLKRPRTTAEYRSSLKSTREEVIRLHDLTEALLMVTRGDQQRLGPDPGKVDVTDVITEVVSRSHPLASAKQVTIKFDPPTVELVVLGSEKMLEQLLTNLVENAVKFTPKKGKVTIRAKQTSHDISICITDTGIGMTEIAVSQAFERFYRADEARQQSGFGLGLSICKAIVEQHKGTIGLQSEFGHGTTVKVSLPRT